MANYFLFLDELKANNEYNHFCIGGCFIEEQYYREIIIKEVNKLKSEIFGKTSIILHETEIRSHKGDFKKLKDKEKEIKFWKMLGNYFESRNMQADFELYEHYNMIKENGTLFLSSELMKDHLRCISFPLKLDNNVGLQLADFVPNPIARNFQGQQQRELNIFIEIKNKAYNGNIDRNDRFGLKKVL